MFPDWAIYLAAAALIFGAGIAAGRFGLRTAVRRERSATMRGAEELFRARAIQDLRDETSARIEP